MIPECPNSALRNIVHEDKQTDIAFDVILLSTYIHICTDIVRYMIIYVCNTYVYSDYVASLLVHLGA